MTANTTEGCIGGGALYVLGMVTTLRMLNIQWMVSVLGMVIICVL